MFKRGFGLGKALRFCQYNTVVCSFSLQLILFFKTVVITKIIGSKILRFFHGVA